LEGITSQITGTKCVVYPHQRHPWMRYYGPLYVSCLTLKSNPMTIS
jgi:hypothetical protein